MASGWTESGINWESLQNYSPRDVIRELYVAVNERNYWLEYFGTGGWKPFDEIEPIDYSVTERHRTKDQINYILNTVSRWLTDSVGYNTGVDNDVLKNGVQGSLIDVDAGSDYEFTNYGDPADFVGEYNPETQLNNSLSVGEIQLGYKSFNTDLNGSTESLIGQSLEFLRRYKGGESQRFTYGMMYAVYLILNNLNYCRYGCYSYVENTKTAVNAIPYSAYFLRQRQQTVCFIKQAPGGSNQGQGFSFDAQRQYLYDNASSFGSDNASVINNLINIRGSVANNNWFINTNRIYGRNTYFYFDFIGYNGQNFKTGDFDFLNAVYVLGFANSENSSWPTTGYQVIRDADFYLPGREKGHHLFKNNTRFLTTQTGDFEINPFVVGEHLINGFDIIKEGDIPDSIETTPPGYVTTVEGNFIEQTMPMINFNKEGFLKYYTEATN